MSSLTAKEKLYLEKLFDMKTGYVLNYTNHSFGAFFATHDIGIHASKYENHGTSKANKMRSFWEQDSDAVVGKILAEMIEVHEANCELNDNPINEGVLSNSKAAVARLLGEKKDEAFTNENDFLQKNFVLPELEKLPVESHIMPVIEQRMQEAQLALNAKAFLASILLCGSALEGILLGVAQRQPKRFNCATSSPKREGKVKPFQEWSLAQFIDVACEVGMIKPDVKKFSHGLREFRNYIHPYEQLTSGFTPDEHTAQLCMQTFKAALASLAGER